MPNVGLFGDDRLAVSALAAPAGLAKQKATQLDAVPGQTITILGRVVNDGTDLIDDVLVGFRLPPQLTAVDGSTRLFNALTPYDGTVLADGATTGLLKLGASFSPGAVSFLAIDATLADASSFSCGTTTLSAGFVSRLPVYTTDEVRADAIVRVNREC